MADLGTGKMAVETAARIAAVLAAAELSTPFVNISDYNMSPADIAIHAVNHASKRGDLGFLHRAVTFHEGD